MENIYDELDALALQIRMDYGFCSPYIDVFLLTKLMNIELVKYSELDQIKMAEIRNYPSLEDGFSVINKINEEIVGFTIFYNDEKTFSRQRFTIAHEIKHIIYLEENPTRVQEKLANHFARALLIPSCMLIPIIDQKNFTEIKELFGISSDATKYAIRSARSRLLSCDKHIANYEEKFLNYINEHNKEVK